MYDRWYESGDEVIALAQWLDEHGYWTEPGQVIDYFSSPHKWTPEHRLYVVVSGSEPDCSRCGCDLLDVPSLTDDDWEVAHEGSKLVVLCTDCWEGR